MERPTANELRDFMQRHKLTLNAMAEQSRLGRATIARYRKHGTEEADEFRVERLVRFMKKLDRRQQKGGSK